jgi:hypothetical protein
MPSSFFYRFLTRFAGSVRGLQYYPEWHCRLSLEFPQDHYKRHQRSRYYIFFPCTLSLFRISSRVNVFPEANCRSRSLRSFCPSGESSYCSKRRWSTSSSFFFWGSWLIRENTCSLVRVISTMIIPLLYGIRYISSE